MSSQVVLRLAGIGKCYATFRSNLQRFANWFGAAFAPAAEYWAVRDVSFELRAGEALALVGQNGAGKSTLLKLVTGTIRPTVGRIDLGGRVSAILELGLGFNPELTGRQNVFQAGGLLGFSSATIEGLLPEIQEFTEIGDFFDQPVRVYSSGMQARLAFALATAVRPDVLIVDEVLSVGDSYFQHKSFDRIRQFKAAGTAILLVTHGLGDVRALCDRAILLDRGRVLKDGQPDEVVDYYNAMIAEKESAKLTIEQRRQENGWLQTRSGTGEVVIESIDLLDSDTTAPVAMAFVGQKLEVRLIARVQSGVPRLVLGYMIRDRSGHVIWGTNTWHTKQIIEDLREGERVEFILKFDCDLGPGSYSISPSLVSSDTHLSDNFDWRDNALVFDVVNSGHDFFIGSTHLPAKFQILR